MNKIADYVIILVGIILIINQLIGISKYWIAWIIGILLILLGISKLYRKNLFRNKRKA